MLSPQQDNSSDCGVYVLLATSVIVQRLLAPELLQKGANPWSLQNILFNAETGRLQIQRMIAEMIDQRGRKIGTKFDIEITPSPAVSQKQAHPAKVSL